MNWNHLNVKFYFWELNKRESIRAERENIFSHVVNHKHLCCILCSGFFFFMHPIHQHGTDDGKEEFLVIHSEQFNVLYSLKCCYTR